MKVREMTIGTLAKSRRKVPLFRSVRLAPVYALAGLLTGAGLSGNAQAQDDPNSADTAAARALAVEGLKLADAGHCPEAVDKLSRAEKLHHAPIVLARLGECQVSLGKLVDGTEMLRRVLREPLPANPSPALVKARERAQSTLDATKPKIAALVISVKGPHDGAAVVTVDGQPVSVALLDAERPTDPGEHMVEASAPGFLKVVKRISVGPGEKQSASLELAVDPQAAVAPAPAPVPLAPADTGGAAPTTHASADASSAPAEPSSHASSPSHAASYVLWAIGGTVGLVGAGFGVVALKDKSDLQCLDNVCAPGSADRLSSAKTAGTVSTIAFAVGGASLALGTVLYFTAGSTTTGSAKPPLLGLSRPRAWAGVGNVGFAADF